MNLFSKMYLFTTENINGYMKNLDFTNKRVISVVGSGDQCLNIILNNGKYITLFDINPDTEKYLALKIAAIKKLNYYDFLDLFIYNVRDIFCESFINSLDLSKEIMEFWMTKINEMGKNTRVKMFNLQFFEPCDIIKNNLYLSEENYCKLQEKISLAKINFINVNLRNLEIDGYYDYMFLSNIPDYLNFIYKDNYLFNFKKTIDKFSENVRIICMAYVYNIYNNNMSAIDNIKKVQSIFNDIEIIKVAHSIKNENFYCMDAVLIKNNNL